MAALTKQRRGLLNNTINREIKDRERKEFETLVEEIGTKSHFIKINPVYSEWTNDKERGQWYPEYFDKNVGNADFDNKAFATEFVDAMDVLHSKMCSLTRVTNREYEETYQRMFAASYNIGRFYMEWEESMFGMTLRVEKWKNS